MLEGLHTQATAATQATYKKRKKRRCLRRRNGFCSLDSWKSPASREMDRDVLTGTGPAFLRATLAWRAFGFEIFKNFWRSHGRRQITSKADHRVLAVLLKPVCAPTPSAAETTEYLGAAFIMAKRKAGDDKQPSKTKMDIDGDESGSDDDIDMLDVDFSFQSPDAEVDFHGLKTLLRQLFDVDNQLLDLSALTDLMLHQSHIGTTVKCEGDEGEGSLSDPYAFISILSLTAHQEAQCIKDLRSYLVDRCQAAKATGKLSPSDIKSLLGHSGSQVGLLLNERFINMPHQVIPPLYRMLADEISEAATSTTDSPNPWKFTHYLILSKVYTEVDSQLDNEDSQLSKKPKKSKGSLEIFYFHPEDEVLAKHAEATVYFEYSKQNDEGASDAKRAFQEAGVKPMGCLMLIDQQMFAQAVKAVETYLGGEAQ